MSRRNARPFVRNIAISAVCVRRQFLSVRISPCRLVRTRTRAYVGRSWLTAPATLCSSPSLRPRILARQRKAEASAVARWPVAGVSYPWQSESRAAARRSAGGVLGPRFPRPLRCSAKLHGSRRVCWLCIYATSSVLRSPPFCRLVLVCRWRQLPPGQGVWPLLLSEGRGWWSRRRREMLRTEFASRPASTSACVRATRSGRATDASSFSLGRVHLAAARPPSTQARLTAHAPIVNRSSASTSPTRWAAASAQASTASEGLPSRCSRAIWLAQRSRAGGSVSWPAVGSRPGWCRDTVCSPWFAREQSGLVDGITCGVSVSAASLHGRQAAVALLIGHAARSRRRRPRVATLES